MKLHFFGIGMVVTALAMITLAGDPPSQPLATGYIEKFEVPERDAEGNLRWKLSGDRAQFGMDGLMTVLNMRAEFYQSNEVGLVFSAPRATLDQAHRRASTDAPVRLEAANIVVTGEGAEWMGGSNTFLVRSNVHVLIKGERLPTIPSAEAEPTPPEPTPEIEPLPENNAGDDELAPE